MLFAMQLQKTIGLCRFERVLTSQQQIRTVPSSCGCREPKEGDCVPRLVTPGRHRPMLPTPQMIQSSAAQSIPITHLTPPPPAPAAARASTPRHSSSPARRASSAATTSAAARRRRRRARAPRASGSAAAAARTGSTTCCCCRCCRRPSVSTATRTPVACSSWRPCCRSLRRAGSLRRCRRCLYRSPPLLRLGSSACACL